MNAESFAELHKLSEKYQELNDKLRSQLRATAGFAAQETENKVVLEELQELEDDAIVYRSLGPLLHREDREESMDNVQKRLAYIADEHKRSQKTMDQTRLEIEELARKIRELQSKLQEAH